MTEVYLKVFSMSLIDSCLFDVMAMAPVKVSPDRAKAKVKTTSLPSLVARRATYVVDGRFFGHFFWKVEGSSAHTRESHAAHMWH